MYQVLLLCYVMSMPPWCHQAISYPQPQLDLIKVMLTYTQLNMTWTNLCMRHPEILTKLIYSASSALLQRLTQVFDGVVSLFAVHSDRLSVGASHSVADDVTSDQDVGAERWGPGHNDAVWKWPHM